MTTQRDSAERERMVEQATQDGYGKEAAERMADGVMLGQRITRDWERAVRHV